ncbi:glycosyltransferase family 1 protein [Rathayibacter sp. YIM 133350]|uniref:glycosyltransferase family 4 protein n=1 Tax=Rathayibacter sp. YIM 133350 TaxID=3131992 RepID=UPI00307D983B
MPEERSIRVLIDATSIPSNRGGVGRYVEHLIESLPRPGLDVIVLSQRRDRDEFSSFGVRVHPAPRIVRFRPLRLLWEQFGVQRAARRLGADIIHSVHYTFPLFNSLPQVVSVHDLTFFSHPDAHSKLKRVFFRRWIKLAARRRVEVVVPSEATAKEFVRLAGGRDDDVMIAMHGVDPGVFRVPSEAEVTAFRASYSPRAEGWIAFLGTVEPRKNTAALIAAYRSVAGTKEGPSLLLAGGDGWGPSIEPAVAEASHAGWDVRRLGYLPLDDLPAFLGGATLVVYPSLGEGFGLPVLEAMTTGACVLTTRELAIPEVGGDAVAYSGTSSSAIARGIEELLGNPERRQLLRERALVRSRMFTWARSANAHVSAYRRAIDR